MYRRMSRRAARTVGALSAGLLATLAAAAPAGAQASGVVGAYQLINASTGMCAAIGNNSTQPGAGLIQYKCDSKSNKVFTFEYADAGASFLHPQNGTGTLCVSVKNNSMAEHALLTQENCVGALSQAWVVTPQADGTYTLAARSSGQCMTVGWDQRYSGQPLDQAVCGTFALQSWKLKAVSPATQ